MRRISSRQLRVPVTTFAKRLRVRGARSISSVAWAVLQKQDAACSAAIIQHLSSDPCFVRVSKAEELAILRRDSEDAEKLQKGIQIGIDKRALPANPSVEPYVSIDVFGKSPDEVAEEILAGIPERDGVVIVLCGLSGTGKGTTVTKLSEKLPHTVTWSNGNVFRAVTLLAATKCEVAGLSDFDEELALSPSSLQGFMGMLAFVEHPDRDFDIAISGLGLECFVGDIMNSELKGPKVTSNIPTVAQQTQGEVITFSASAIEKMRQSGKNILLEGREETVDYVPSKYRFSLTMSDRTAIGQRRAAQVIGANALKLVALQLSNGRWDVRQDDIDSAINKACRELDSALDHTQ